MGGDAVYRPALCPEQPGEARLRASSFFSKLIRSVFGVGLPRFEISATYQNFMNAPDTAVWIQTGNVRAKRLEADKGVL